MTLKRRQIVGLFTDPVSQMEDGLFLSGRRGEGEFLAWHRNGRLWQHCWFRGGKHDGVYQEWFEDGRLAMRFLFRDGKRIRVLR